VTTQFQLINIIILYPLAVQTEILCSTKHKIASFILSHYYNVSSQGVNPLHTKYFTHTLVSTDYGVTVNSVE